MNINEISFRSIGSLSDYVWVVGREVEAFLLGSFSTRCLGSSDNLRRLLEDVYLSRKKTRTTLVSL